MKKRFMFFGIPTPARRAVVKAQMTSLGRAPDADWLLTVADALWTFDERECQYMAVDLLVKFAAHWATSRAMMRIGYATGCRHMLIACRA